MSVRSVRRKNTVFFESLKNTSLFKPSLEAIENAKRDGDEDLAKKYQDHLDRTMGNLTMVYIYFSDLGITQYSREELYGIIDVIGTNCSLDHSFNFEKCVFSAAVGGIIGLCVWASARFLRDPYVPGSM